MVDGGLGRADVLDRQAVSDSPNLEASHFGHRGTWLAG